MIAMDSLITTPLVLMMMGWSNRTRGDCDDDPLIHPDEEELDNGYDDNCNGFVDEGSENFDDDRDGFAESEGDCDDSDPWVWPENTEDCDGIDNDCDGLIDEGEDNTESGACAFVAERETVQPLENPQGGCSQAESGQETWWIIGCILALFARRPRCQSHN